MDSVIVAVWREACNVDMKNVGTELNADVVGV